MKPDELAEFLGSRSVSFERKPIQNAEQFRIATGEIIAVYDSGKSVFQGKKTPLRDELEAWDQTGFTPAPRAINDEAGAEVTDADNLNVFVVYGHDQSSRDVLELLLRRMDLVPIILAHLPAGGDTIIEKLEHYLVKRGNVGFACVLLTPDDEGYRSGASEERKYRARQNVVLELGMVLSRLNRKRVAILTKESVERPSDIGGLLYLPFKESVSEVGPQLFQELKNAGYEPNPQALR